MHIVSYRYTHKINPCWASSGRTKSISIEHCRLVLDLLQRSLMLYLWALHCEGIYAIHYLDDFLVSCNPYSSLSDAGHMRSRVEGLFGRLNDPIANHKTDGPTSVLTFLGIEIDTDQFQLRLPSAKILRLNSLLQQWARRRCCTRKDLESLLGHLSHAAIVIKPGRIFLASLFSLLSVVSHPSHFIRLNVEARTDLGLWHCLIKHWNGRSFFPLPEPSVHVFSDASGSFGCGAFCGNSWFQVQWPHTWASTSIAGKELVPVVMAAALWGSGWAGQCLF